MNSKTAAGRIDQTISSAWLPCVNLTGSAFFSASYFHMKRKQSDARGNENDARENENEHEQTVNDAARFTHVRRQPMVGRECQRTATHRP